MKEKSGAINIATACFVRKIEIVSIVFSSVEQGRV